MNEDNLYLIGCYIIYGLTLFLLTLKSKNRRQTLFINLIVLAVYSGFFLYNLKYNNSFGSGLVWLAGLMTAIGIHWLTNLINLTIITIRKHT